MPYFKWYGINQSGSINYGLTQARDAQELDSKLQNNNTTLLWVIPFYYKSLLRPINSRMRSSFYRQLSILLDSGIYLEKALTILAEQTAHSIFREIILDMRLSISAGIPLHITFAHHRHIFCSVDQGLLQTGQEIGQLSRACSLLADYYDEKEILRKKMRNALLLPAITFGIFIIISLVIIVILVPLFAELFLSMGHELPTSTQKLLMVADFCQSYALVILGIILLSGISLKKLQNKSIRTCIDRWVLSIPFFGKFILQKEMLFFLQSLYLSTEGKIPIISALRIARASINNIILAQNADLLIEQVEKGYSLAEAFKNNKFIISSDCLALIRTGQESSNLSLMLKQASVLYQEQLNRRLALLSTLLQPFLMIILGSLVLFLIVSIYSPIFSLSFHIA